MGKGRGRCKSCLNAELRAWRARNKDRVRASNRQAAERGQHRKHRETHREQQAASLKAWKQANREKVAEYERRRRIRKRTEEQEAYDRWQVFEDDGWVCQLCFEPVVERDPNHRFGPTIDHVTALANGGPDCRSNVQLAHRSCNARKRPYGWVSHSILDAARAAR